MKNDRLSKQRYDLEKAYEQKKQARDRILGKEVREEVQRRKKDKPGWQQQFQQFREVNREQYERRKSFMDELTTWQKQLIAEKMRQQLPTREEAEKYLTSYWTSNPLLKRMDRMKNGPDPDLDRPEHVFCCMWCAQEFGDVDELEAHEEGCE